MNHIQEKLAVLRYFTVKDVIAALPMRSPGKFAWRTGIDPVDWFCGLTEQDAERVWAYLENRAQKRFRPVDPNANANDLLF